MKNIILFWTFQVAAVCIFISGYIKCIEFINMPVKVLFIMIINFIVSLWCIKVGIQFLLNTRKKQSFDK